MRRLTPLEVADAVERFERDGFVLLRDLVPRVVVRAVLRRFEAAVDLLAERWLRAGLITDTLADSPLTLRYLELLRRSDARVPAAWRRNLVSQEIYQLWRQPELLAIVERLVGPEVYAHGVWNGRPRDPYGRSQQVRWHQDAYYYKGWRKEQGPFVSVWMPLVPVDEMTACLQFLRSSHQAGWLPRLRLEDGEYGVEEHALAHHDIVTCPMKPGDVVLFSDTTVHASTPNLGDGVRWSVDFRFAPAAPEVIALTPRGYYCRSEDPDRVESFERWASRYRYEPGELLDELTNFEDGYDVAALRTFSTRSPFADMY